MFHQLEGFHNGGSKLESQKLFPVGKMTENQGTIFIHLQRQLLKVPITTAADDIYKYFFIFFFSFGTALFANSAIFILCTKNAKFWEINRL